jgi:hypothetical protein
MKQFLFIVFTGVFCLVYGQEQSYDNARQTEKKVNLKQVNINISYDSLLRAREVVLKDLLANLRNAQNDQQKEQANSQFKSYLEETIKIKGSFDYPFTSLKSVGTVKSPDNTFRLFNWNVEQDDHSNKYYCYILRFDAKKKNWKIIELQDKSFMLPAQPDDILTEDNWYGALYYKIIPIAKSNKTYYTILGWDGISQMSNCKLIDVISFSGDHVKLGSPIFKTQDGVHKRLFFEHSKKAFMSLNYDDDRQRIIFDHLAPETENLEGFREFYVPDLSYDELKFFNNKWHLREDVVGINNPDKKSQRITYSKQKKDGSYELTEKEVKVKWIDPSDANAPNGGNVHVAHLPEYEILKKENSAKISNQTNKLAKTAKKTKKNEFSMNPFLSNKRRR